MVGFLFGLVAGLAMYLAVCVLLIGWFTVRQNARSVITSFGHAERIESRTTLDSPIAEHLSEEHRARYHYPQVRMIGPGGPYFKWPWKRVHRVNVAIQTVNTAYDPDAPPANYNKSSFATSLQARGTSSGCNPSRPVSRSTIATTRCVLPLRRDSSDRSRTTSRLLWRPPSAIATQPGTSLGLRERRSHRGTPSSAMRSELKLSSRTSPRVVAPPSTRTYATSTSPQTPFVTPMTSTPRPRYASIM
jgi:hypothetical protein